MRITRRDFLRTAGAGAAGLALSGMSCLDGEEGSKRPNPGGPNLLYIMTDQQRFDSVRASGNPHIQTPNLDRLATEGAKFTNFYTAAFPCSPSRGTIQTGRYPHSHGVWINDAVFDKDITAFGDVASAKGYDTGWIGKWHLGGRMYGENYAWQMGVSEEGLQKEKEDLPRKLGEDVPQHGFEHWVGGHDQYLQYLGRLGLQEPRPGKKVRGAHHTVIEDGHSVIPEDHFMTAFLAREAMDFLSQPERRERPFALCLSFYGPHLPITPPEPWDKVYPREEVPLPGNLNDDLLTKPWRTQHNNKHWMRKRWTDAEYRDIIARYYGYVSYIDHWTGKVLDTLREQRLADDTIVVYTSDHGEMIGSHGFIYKGPYMYDEVQKVPFIIRAPGTVPAGVALSALASNVDLLPTLLDMLDIEEPAGVQGKSFLPLLRGERQTHREAAFTQINSPGTSITMARTERWKYSYNWEPRQIDELYDMEADPLELDNLAESPPHQRVAREMLDRTIAWMEESDHPLLKHAKRARDRQRVRPKDVRAEVTEFEYLGEGRFRFAYQWRNNDSFNERIRGFVQFLHDEYGEPGKGNISFRIVSWPETPTDQWEPGNAYPMPPAIVEIPPWASTGEYPVRIGLYDEQKRQGPALLQGSGDNSMIVGDLIIERDGDAVADVRFRPAA